MKIAWTLYLSGAVLAAAANAQVRMDTDEDGRVSGDEFAAAQAELAAGRFAALDRDGDGFLTETELRARLDRGRERRERMRERIAEVDADADGAWSLAEIKAVRPEFDAERFARLDANADGLLQADERQDRHRGRPGGQRRPASP